MSVIFLSHVNLSSMSHVDLKKWPCRPVEFKGPWPPEYVGHKLLFMGNSRPAKHQKGF